MTLEIIRKNNDTGKSDFLVMCDHRGCKAALDAMHRTFFQATQFIRARGWKTIKVHGSWHHYCPKHLPTNGHQVTK